MVKLTDKDISYEPRLIRKLDIAIDRMVKHKFDNLFIVEGAEGYGKSNMACAICNYISFMTKRIYTVDNVHFDCENMFEQALTTEKQIIHWDEAAMAGLASDWQKKTQRKLIKMLMMARKKRHFYVFCIPKMTKLNEYLVERAVGMIRVYAKNETQLGKFVYYGKEALRRLYEYWRTKKIVAYKKFAQFPLAFHGTFPDCLAKIIDEEEYERKKDEAIKSLLKEEKKEGINHKERALQSKMIGLMLIVQKKIGCSFRDVCNMADLSENMVRAWKSNHLNELEREKYQQSKSKIEENDTKEPI